MQKSTLTLFSLILIAVFSMLICFDYTYATTSSLSLSIDSSTVSLDVTPVKSSGTFRKSSANTISASTNNATGYTLKITAPTGAGSNYDKLINTTDNTKKINSIASAISEADFSNSSATAYNNTWGYLPSKYCPDGTSSTCDTNTNFLPAPTTSGDVLDNTSTANSTANTYNLVIGTRVNQDTASGTYRNTYIITAVANATPYTITYNANGGSGAPTNVSSATYDESVTLSRIIPTKALYDFLGWCTVTPTTAAGIDSCTGGTTYSAGGSYIIDQTGRNNNLELYAMWEELKTIANSTNMQDVTSCPGELTTGQVYTIKDSRDNTEYHVTKLADGKCWMLDNIALDLTSSTTLNRMNSSNTNASDTTLGYLRGTTTRNPSTDPDGNYATSRVANWTTDYSYSDPLVNLSNKNVVPSNPPTNGGGSNKVGGYYNYCAASAGSYCYGNRPSEGTSTTNATEDICPKGWRMPIGDDPYGRFKGEFIDLNNITSYNSYDDYRNALSLPLSGYFWWGSTYEQGNSGYWWSSTGGFSDTISTPIVSTSSLSLIASSGRAFGYTVRCILDL